MAQGTGLENQRPKGHAGSNPVAPANNGDMPEWSIGTGLEPVAAELTQVRTLLSPPIIGM